MPGQNLTREEAQLRAEVISDPHYRISLDLTRGERVFTSVTEIDFTAVEGGSSFIDLVADAVKEVTLNGVALDPGIYADSRMPLEGLAAQNTLRVVADCLYTRTGVGLHRFTDPQDGQSYVYSHFEVPDSRRVYAVFEQPDLKADFTFTVTTPAGWKCFSNSPTPEPEYPAGATATNPTETGAALVYRFTPTEKISSYITAIVAGPYVGRTGELTSIDGRTIPLGVYCRASMEEHLDAEEIMDITRAGFKFYEEAFGFPYPFRKYDQIFVPEYNAGAMENAACVTFRDEYVFRSRPLEARVERRTVTILHELAHMWFGDLVTMKWWNDLWLNESFAEYISTLAVSEVTRWKEVWTTFSAAEKAWAYRQDQLPSTHPIVAEIRDIEDVLVNFDGITYAKGACALSLLVSYVGWDNFRRAISQYFQSHQWSNAVLADLIHELQVAASLDLSEWSRVWLQEAGMTWLRPELGVGEDGLIQSLRICQSVFTPGASLRPMRMAVRGYSLTEVEGRTVFVGGHSEEFTLEGEGHDVSGFVGQPRPDVLLVNDRDLAYGKLRLDPASLQVACDNIEKFTDSLPRAQVMAVLWDMVRDGEVAASRYVEVALRALAVESNSTVVQVMLNALHTCVESYVHPSKREALDKMVGDRLLLLARTAESGSDAQLQLVRSVGRRAVTAQQLQAVQALLDGEAPLEGLVMDTELKWNLLTSLCAAGHLGQDRVDAMLQEDDTVNGRERALQAGYARPDAAVKAQAFQRAYADRELTNDQLISVISGFNRAREAALLAPHAPEYFAALEDTFRDRSFEVAEELIEGLYPYDLVGFQEETGVDVLGMTQSWLDSHPDSPAALRRLVLESQSVAQRIATAQARDLEG